ncbi:hypothetical protein AALC25_11355 [Lachnospiraceae bacterium 29-84]
MKNKNPGSSTILGDGVLLMLKHEGKMPTTWNRKYPDKTECHIHFEQSSILLGIIPAVLFLVLSLGEIGSAQISFCLRTPEWESGISLGGADSENRGKEINNPPTSCCFELPWHSFTDLQIYFPISVFI